MKVFLILFLISIMITPVFAQSNSQVLPTEKGTLLVDFKTEPATPKPGDIIKFKIDFLNPSTNQVQEHIDYTLEVTKGDSRYFGPIPLTHTSTGSVTIPVQLQEEGKYSATIGVEGILFQPIPEEMVTFEINVGQAAAQPPNASPSVNTDGGGCLIATATYGSELAPQVQQLRELRDNVVMTTKSGESFMKSFNGFYYSFSPAIADFERENSVFRESVKLAITPLLTTLSILNHVGIDSEEEMLSYGIGVILLNAGIYIGIPTFAILKLYHFKRKFE